MKRNIGTERRATVALVFTIFALVAAPASAHYHYYDDTCDVLGDNYFWPGGPATDWFLDTDDGIGSCLMWTGTTSLATNNTASWYLPLSSNYDHNYYVKQYFDNNSGKCTAANARYQRFATGTAGGIHETYRFDESVLNGWYSITGSDGDPNNYDSFTGSAAGYMRMSDWTGNDTKRVCADAMEYVVA
jgi:hypothetical protein